MIESSWMRLVIKATEIMKIPFPSLVLLYISVPSKIKCVIIFQAFPVNSFLNSNGYGRHIK